MNDDTISRQAAIREYQKVCNEIKCGECPFLIKVNTEKGSHLITDCKLEVFLHNLPSAGRQGHWIPVTERLPEEDKEVLISYRYKEGEGNTSHSKIDITSYGQMYFGGNKVGRVKHWRAPFEYFESNYEVIAWMPLPTPYKGGEEE